MSAKPDLLYAALKAQVGRDGTTPDLWSAYLRGLGYSGAFPDMAARHAASLGISVQEYYNTDGTLFAGAPPSFLTEINPVSFSQSSTFSSFTATTSNMRDANGNGDPVTGAGTNSEANPWIRADLGSAKEVCMVTLGAGDMPGWGTISTSFPGSLVEYSTDDSTWTPIRAIIDTFTDSPTADRDVNLYFSPVTAQYWRIRRATTNFFSTATFRFYGYSTPLTRRTGITYSQSSVFGTLTASEATLNDVPADKTTGAATNSDAGAFIMADLGASYDIQLVVVSGGTLAGWGSVALYLTSRVVQTSPDGTTWTTRGTIPSGLTDSDPAEWAVSMNVNARYVRLAVASGSGFVSTSALRVYTK